MGFPKGIDQTTIKVVLEYASNFSFQIHSQNLISVANSNVPLMVIYTKMIHLSKFLSLRRYAQSPPLPLSAYTKMVVTIHNENIVKI